MKLIDIIQRNNDLKPWIEGERIPWDDAEFSKRVLKEHLSQESSAASKQMKVIQKECAWIFNTLMKNQPGKILDLGCGPGLYTEIFAQKRNYCVGIDFAPAAIEYAKKHATKNCVYELGDIRQADFGEDYDAVVYLFGAINLLPTEDVKKIINKGYTALKPGGFILIESSSIESVDQIGNQPSMWYSADEGLFSTKPHLCLMESFWDDNSNTATERYYIVDSESNAVQHHCASTKGYEEEELETLLSEAGFHTIEFFPNLTGEDPEEMEEFITPEFTIVMGKK